MKLLLPNIPNYYKNWILIAVTFVPSISFAHNINYALKDAPTQDIIWYYTKLGIGHIIPEGIDHVLFIIALCLLNNKIKTTLWQATAFTVAHSITLAMSMKNIIVSPSAIMEPVISLSIVFVAIENMLFRELKPWRIVIVFIFGLIHGMGFATALNETDTTGVFNFLDRSFAGKWLLPFLAVGLLFYAAWRFIEAFRAANNIKKDWAKCVRYALSGLVYGLVSLTAFRIVFNSGSKKSDNQQQFASELLSRPFGQWLLGLAALVIAGIGAYQVYYGLSEKYKKHVQKMSLKTKAAAFMLSAGKTGYVARGLVWLIISYLMLQAAFASSSSKAGDTGKAFEFLERSPMGSYLLGALGTGLIAYGLFNFIRSRYENF